jgi:hypothetical protein
MYGDEIQPSGYRAIWLQMLKSQQSWVQFQHPPPTGYGLHDVLEWRGVDRVKGGGQMGVDPDPQQTIPKIQSWLNVREKVAIFRLCTIHLWYLPLLKSSFYEYE